MSVRNDRTPPQADRILSDPGVTVIVVEHHDRLTGFGFDLAASMAGCGQRTLPSENSETISDLIGDVIEVPTSLCAWMYWQRPAARRAEHTVVVATGGQPT